MRNELGFDGERPVQFCSTGNHAGPFDQDERLLMNEPTSSPGGRESCFVKRGYGPFSLMDRGSDGQYFGSFSFLI
jgi:hypothetical protein